MHELAFHLGARPLSWPEAALGAGGLALLLLAVTAIQLLRARRDRAVEAALAGERAREMDERMAELARLQAETAGRMQTMAEVLGSRQGDFVRAFSERIESLQHRMGQGLQASSERQAETLAKLHERIAVIDAAQRNLRDLTGEVASLKEVLSNKQARGAYGQGRMEAIVRDGLPASAYEFQATLSNGTRPDCLVRLPGDPRGLVVDAKFPLESFSGFRQARSDEGRIRAAARVRQDVGAHLKDIARKYLVPGETQDVALMFVPAESLHADLQEHFEDLVQRAHRMRVLIVSPSLLGLAIQVLQGLVRDARIREEARVIQTEVGRLLEDVSRLADRVGRLDGHFRQAQEDVSAIRTSADKIARRGERIGALDFDEPEPRQGCLLAGARPPSAAE